MLILLASPEAVAPNGSPDIDLVVALKRADDQGSPVFVVSNHAQPTWFEDVFAGSDVQFETVRGRQDGRLIKVIAEKLQFEPFSVLVLAASVEDVAMGKNGGAVLLAAGWSRDVQVRNLGIRVADAEELGQVIGLLGEWSGQWWFSGEGSRYSVRALVDLSAYGRPVSQQQFSRKLTRTVKDGGARLNTLLTVTARSLLADGVGNQGGLVWGVYPSSASSNDDSEVLSEFTHRLRTTVSRVRYAKADEPLFVRHTRSTKRSGGSTGNRRDPTEQICTLHLNPFYSEKGRLRDKHVIVVDDCTTYGVSFGVAAAFLRQAGAESVTGVALGKFGNCLEYYELDIDSDPFAPVTAKGFTIRSHGPMGGRSAAVAQQALIRLIP